MASITDKYKDGGIGYRANCGIGASELIGSIKCFSKSVVNEDQFIVAKGNCGIPQFKGTEIKYDGTPELMARYALYARNLGAKIIGGCCGTTQSHVKAMSDALNNQSKGPVFELNQVIEDLGAMTEGNIQMIENYLNPNTSRDSSEGRKRRRGRRKIK